MGVRPVTTIFAVLIIGGAVGSAIWSTAALAAAELVSLSEYLSRANAAGMSIIYSSDLVRSRYRVTIDPDAEITIDKVKRALGAYDLAVRQSADNVWTVVRVEPPAIPAPHPDATDTPFTPPLEELVVSSSRYRLLVQRTGTVNMLGHDQLVNRPATGNDATRLVNKLPGSASEGVSARPRVRGGKADETLILFDGIRLYEPFHFNNYNNMISGFDSRIIESLDFYSGGFPARMGDRLSAAMVIEPRLIDDDQKVAGLGLFNLSWFQTGNDARAGWLLAARRSSLDWFTGLAETDPGTPTFGDAYARYEWRTGRGEWSANVFWFGDDMEIRNASRTEESTSHYGNTYAWIRWSSDELGLDSWVSVATIKDERQGTVDKPGQTTGTLYDSREFGVYNLKQVWQYAISSEWLLEAGWDYRYMDASYRFDSDVTIAPAFAALANFLRPSVRQRRIDETGHQLAVFSSVKTSLSDRLTTELGVRLDMQHYEHGFDARQLSPRVNLLFEPAPGTEIRLGWGRFDQADGLHELKIGDGVASFLPAQKSVHTVLGIHHTFAVPWLGFDIDTRIESYRKRGLTGTTYFENLTNPLSLLPELQADRYEVDADGFDARGVEFSLSGEREAIEWWFNYTYSSVKDRLGGIEIERSWDQSHSANLGVSLAVGNWQWSPELSWHSGWQTTPLTFDGTLVRAQTRNSMRFGNFVTVDLKATREWRFGDDRLRLEAGVTNLFNRENVIGFDYVLEAGELVRQDKHGLPIVPFLDVYWRF